MGGRALEKGITEHRHWEGGKRKTVGKGTYLPGSEGDTNKKREQQKALRTFENPQEYKRLLAITCVCVCVVYTNIVLNEAISLR